MKKWIFGLVLVFGIFLCGCNGTESYEVLSDDIVGVPIAEPAKVELKLPEDSALAVMSGSDWQYYEGEHYQIILQTFSSGNLDQTLQNITGYQIDNLSVIETSVDGIDKFHCAWSAVSDEGELVGRCTILDDGMYHYCLSVLVEADAACEVRDTIDAVFATYALEGY